MLQGAIEFSVVGPNEIHLAGNVLDNDDGDDMGNLMNGEEDEEYVLYMHVLLLSQISYCCHPYVQIAGDDDEDEEEDDDEEEEDEQPKKSAQKIVSQVL